MRDGINMPENEHLTIEKLKNLEFSKGLGYVRLIVKTPKSINTETKFQKWFNRMFSLDINMDEDSEYQGYIYYNFDERSLCGDYEDFHGNTATIVLQLCAYVDGFEKEFLKLLKYVIGVCEV